MAQHASTDKGVPSMLFSHFDVGHLFRCPTSRTLKENGPWPTQTDLTVASYIRIGHGLHGKQLLNGGVDEDPLTSPGRDAVVAELSHRLAKCPFVPLLTHSGSKFRVEPNDRGSNSLSHKQGNIWKANYG